MANDLFSALRTYLSKVSSGEKSPQEVAAALNAWARESGEAIKQRVEEEVQRSVKRMGFAKQEDLDRLAREVETLKTRLITSNRLKRTTPKTTKSAPVKKSTKKKPVKKLPARKKAAK